MYNDTGTRRASSTPRLLTGGGRGPFSSDVSNAQTDYFSKDRASVDNRQDNFDSFLDSANRTIGRENKNAPDPFLNPNVALTRPFGAHARVSSVESITSIATER